MSSSLRTMHDPGMGKLVYAHPGPYSKVADLLADIRRYAGA